MRYRAKSILKRTLSFATCMAFSLCFLAGCADKEKTDTSSINDEPNITITTISPIDPPVNSEEVDKGEIDDVYSSHLCFSRLSVAHCRYPRNHFRIFL